MSLADLDPKIEVPSRASSRREQPHRPNGLRFEDGAAGFAQAAGQVPPQDGGQAVVRSRQINIFVHQEN